MSHLPTTALAEIELAQRKQHFFDNASVDQAEFSSAAFCNLASAGKTFTRVAIDVCRHRASGSTPNWQLCEYRMRYPPTSSFRGSASALNLIRYAPAILGRTSTAVAGCLVRMPEFEDNLRIAHRKAIDVGDSAAQNERVVVEAEIGGIAENDLPDLRPEPGFLVGDESDATCFAIFLHELAEIAEGLDRSEAVGLQDQFGFEVGDLV